MREARWNYDELWVEFAIAPIVVDAVAVALSPRAPSIGSGGCCRCDDGCKGSCNGGRPPHSRSSELL